MTRDINDPSASSPSEQRPPEGPLPQERAIPNASAPAGVPLTSSSGDEFTAFLAASLAEAKPDPLLGEFVSGEQGFPPPEPEPAPIPGVAPEQAASTAASPEPSAPVGQKGHAASTPAEEASPIPDVAVNPAPVGDAEAIFVTTSEADVSPPLPEGAPGTAPATEYAAPSSSDALAALAGIANPRPIDITPPHGPSGSVDAFPAFDLGPSVAGTGTAPPKPAAEKDDDFDEEFDDEDDAPRWMSWILPLVISYASAVTIGLVWVLYTGRTLREKPDDFLPAPDTRADPGKHASDSRKIEPPKPIPSENLTTLGKPIRIGQIEVTPLAIASGRVVLERSFNPAEKKDGGADALRLKIRFRNVSKDTILYPFDEAFVREREREVLDSFIETGEDEPIEMYPLAISSEWKIVGQDFPELKPGKSFETAVVSAPKILENLTPEMTWRLRLRVDVNLTDVVGIKFRPADVKRNR